MRARRSRVDCSIYVRWIENWNILKSICKFLVARAHRLSQDRGAYGPSSTEQSIVAHATSIVPLALASQREIFAKNFLDLSILIVKILQAVSARYGLRTVQSVEI